MKQVGESIENPDKKPLVSELVSTLLSILPNRLALYLVLILVTYYGIGSQIDKGEIELPMYFLDHPTELLSMAAADSMIEPLQELGDGEIIKLIDELFVASSNSNEPIIVEPHKVWSFSELMLDTYGEIHESYLTPVNFAGIITMEDYSGIYTTSTHTVPDIDLEALRGQLLRREHDYWGVLLTYQCGGGTDSAGIPLRVTYQFIFRLDQKTGNYLLDFRTNTGGSQRMNIELVTEEGQNLQTSELCEA